MHTLAEATHEAQRRAAIQRHFTGLRAAESTSPAVYILRNCYCLGQGGFEHEYHVHTFTRDAFAAWVADRPDVVVEQTIRP